MLKRLFGPLGLKDTLLPPSQHLEHDPEAVLARLPLRQLVDRDDRRRGPAIYAGVPSRGGTVRPNDYTGVNHSSAFAAECVISTADDLDTWIRALVGGRVLNAKYQRIWRDSLQSTGTSLDYGYGINRFAWAGNALYLHGGETVGYNSEAAYDPANN
jgi:D-alanyl-D-alanine carboxypeptidase